MRPGTGENSLRQSAPALSVTSSVLSWLALKVSETFYSYSKDPAQFLAYLDSTRGLQNRTAGLSSVVSGLPKDETLLQVNIDFPQDWSLTLSEVLARSIIDGTIAKTSKILVAKDLGDSWNVGLGLENQDSVSTQDSLALLSARYSF